MISPPLKHLTTDQRTFYDENGYVVVPGILGPEKISAYLGRARAIAHGDHPAEAAGRLVKDVRFAKKLLPIPDDPELTLWKLLNPDRFDPLFAGFLETPQLLDCMEDIVGPDILTFLLMLIYKPPGVGEALHPFHQDAFYFPFGPHDLCVAAWLPLDDADAENGGLTVMPGSHHGPVMGHHVPDGVQNFGNFSIEDQRHENEPITLSVKAGDLVLFHSRTWHKTEGNPSGRMRRVLTVHAASAKCQATGPMPHEEFGMQRARGQVYEGCLQPLKADMMRRTTTSTDLNVMASERNRELS